MIKLQILLTAATKLALTIKFNMPHFEENALIVWLVLA